MTYVNASTLAKLMDGTWDFTQTIRLRPASDYATHYNYVSDIVSYWVADGVELTGKGYTDGYLEADDVVFPAIPADETVAALYLYHDTGTPSTSRIIAGFGTNADTTTLAIVGNGGSLTVAWPSGRVLKI